MEPLFLRLRWGIVDPCGGPLVAVFADRDHAHVFRERAQEGVVVDLAKVTSGYELDLSPSDIDGAFDSSICWHAEQIAKMHPREVKEI